VQPPAANQRYKGIVFPANLQFFIAGFLLRSAKGEKAVSLFFKMIEIPLISDSAGSGRICCGETVAEAAALLRERPAIFVVFDEAVGPLALELSSALPPASCRGLFPLRASEEGKGLQAVTDICRWLLENGADREALLVGIGGGITTDMTGFAASIYKRGIPFAFIPTTLLAQVDAAIGGKTGVNFLDYKNMLGIIRQPEFTWICPEPLETLPRRAFVGGTAELLKSFLIDDREGKYAEAVDFLSGIEAASDRAAALRSGRDRLSDLIRAAATVKAGIVGRDPNEHGERRKLNLGHTFAHAIERLGRHRAAAPETPEIQCMSQQDIPHGEAVAIGIVLAARLSERVGLAAPGLAGRLTRDLAACGLPTQCPFALTELAAAMEKDKKAAGDEVRFVLPVDVGDVVIRSMRVPEALAVLQADPVAGEPPMERER